MSDEKCWVTFGVSGVGQVAAWVDKEIIENTLDITVQIPELVEGENLSMVVHLPQQIMVQKLAQRGFLNLGVCGMMIPTPPNVVELLAKQWDMVAVAKASDVPRILRHD